MKFSVENESLSLKQLVCSVIEKNHLHEYPHNRMRNLHKDVKDVCSVIEENHLHEYPHNRMRNLHKYVKQRICFFTDPAKKPWYNTS